MIMPIDIDKKEFSRDKKGYNSREVDEFLDLIVADYEKVLNDNRSMAHKIKALEKQLEEAQKDDNAMIETLEKIVRQDISDGDSPEHSAEIFIKTVGKHRAEIVLASLVNRVSWDGRLSGENVQWARSCMESFDEDAMSLMHLYSDKIHCAHLDQLADVFRKSA